MIDIVLEDAGFAAYLAAHHFIGAVGGSRCDRLICSRLQVLV